MSSSHEDDVTLLQTSNEDSNLDIGPDPLIDTEVTSQGGEASKAGDEEDFCFNFASKHKAEQNRLRTEDRSKDVDAGAAEQTRIQEVTADDFYRMDNRRRGKAIIINQERFNTQLEARGIGDRKGTNVDSRAMRHALEAFGFQVMEYNNVNRIHMRQIFTELSEENHSDADCVACVVLSHGEEGVVYGSDGTIEIKELSDYLKGDRCPTLIGKPKLFFIQACRGQQTDVGANVNVADAKGQDDVDARSDTSDIIRLPIESDFLFAYSTVPGFYSWRNLSRGSWFVQVLSDQLKENGHKVELLKLLTVTNRLVAQGYESSNDDPYFNKKKQIPCITSMLTKDIYLTKRRVSKYRPVHQ